jgi:hypothetical protein
MRVGAALIVALEAPNHRALEQLTQPATPVIGSMQLPPS